jgi:hypothetical protein
MGPERNMATDGGGLQIWQGEGHWTCELVHPLLEKATENLDGRASRQSSRATSIPSSARAQAVL